MSIVRKPAGFTVIELMIVLVILGVLVTLVKLSSMAQVLPGIALWSFGALVVVLAAMLSFDPRDLWHYLESPEDAEATDGAPR